MQRGLKMQNFELWNILLDAASGTGDATATATTAGGGLSMVIILVAFVAIFYFMLIRPQRKKDKKIKEMLNALKAGDRICTIGGIYGTIAQIKDDTVTLLVGADKTQMVMARWAIRSVEDAPVENDSEPQV